MDRRFYTNPFVHDQDDSEHMPEHGPDSPTSGDDTKISGAPSPKKRKSVRKKVVSVPIGDVDGSKNRGETYPPSDSWAWRKYGQKPIKGSPYPRGYYRCSSSKGCPARKQVERSRVDPTTLVITYASEHNHPIPATKHHHYNHNHNQNQPSSLPSKTTTTTVTDTSVPAKFTPQEEEPTVFTTTTTTTTTATNHSDLELGGDGGCYGFGWFADDVASTNVLESPICAGSSYCADADVAMVFEMREEDESLFADLGELPECSVVFRRSVVEPEETNRRCSLSAVPCCGSTG